MKLLNRHNFAVSTFGAKEESRYTLNAILVTEKETVATDGHILARVTLPTDEPAKFPIPEGFSDATQLLADTLLPLSAARETEKNLPKKTNLEILKNAAVGRSADGRIEIGVNDLSRPSVSRVYPAQGTFPSTWKDVFPNTDAPSADITLNAELLKRLMDFAVKFTAKDKVAAVRLRVWSANSALRFDMFNSETGQQCNGVVMPLRDSNPKTDFQEPLAAVNVKALLKEIEILRDTVETLKSKIAELKKPASQLAAD